MPTYTICTEEELAEFYPLLKHLFVADEMFNIIKINHSEENCRAGSGPVLNGPLAQEEAMGENSQLVF